MDKFLLISIIEKIAKLGVTLARDVWTFVPLQ